MTYSNPQLSQEELDALVNNQPEVTTPPTSNPIVETLPEELVEEQPQPTAETNQQDGPLSGFMDATLDASREIGVDPTALPRRLAVDALEATGLVPENEGIQELLDVARDPITPAAAGLTDFGVDAFNFVTGLNAPKLPDYSNDAAQAVRELSSIILPTAYLSRLTTTGGTAGLSAVSGQAARGNKTAKLAQRLGEDKLFSTVARMGIPLGSGVAVDWINDLSTEPTNFSTWVKSKLPDQFKWIIPENFVIENSDSPDIRRRKTVLEGAAFGTLGDLLPATAKFINKLRNKNDFLNFIPRNSTAEAYSKRHRDEWNRTILRGEALGSVSASQSGDDFLDAGEVARESFERAGLSRADDMDAMGQYSNSINPNMDEPMLGRNRNMYDLQEEAMISVDDMAVPKAAADVVAINQNQGTFYGRVRNMIQEAALKEGIKPEQLTRRTILKLVRDELRAAGEFAFEGNIKASWKEIDKAGTELAEYLIDPLADAGFIKELLEDYKQITRNIDNLDDVGLNAVSKALSYWNDEYFNLDAMKASALLQTSMAGQIADIAEGARRYDGPELIERAQEMIIDRLELLTNEKQVASYLRGSALNFVNVFNRMWKGHKKWKNQKQAVKAMEREAEALGLTTDLAVQNAVNKNAQYFRELRALAKEDPDLLRPFMLANELTDGDVASMYRFNEFMQANMGVFQRLIFNKDPKLQSLINQGVMSNVYNSLLSAPTTPGLAAISNTAMMLQKPFNVLAGAAVVGDWEGVRRGWYAYHALGETMSEGFKHLAKVWNKSVEAPESVPYVMRDDHAQLNARKLELLDETAKVAEKKGNYGPRYFANMITDLTDLQNHPVLRWGTNALGALDGFQRAVVANGLARYRAYDEMVEIGDFRPEIAKAARKKYFDNMKDQDGFILDPEVEFTAREMSMSLDHPVVDAFNTMINYVPAARIFFMFNRTGVNVVGAGWNHSPASMFVGDYHEIVGPRGGIGYVHSEDEIRDIFTKRGIDINSTPDLMRKFKDLKAEIRGRVAVSSLIMGGLIHSIFSGNCHGDGSMDPAVQRVRDKNGWAKRSCRSPVDGKWYSYAGLGPTADHIAFVANVADNFTQLGTAVTEDLLGKAMFVLASSLTNQTTMAGAEPFFKLIGGQPKDLVRFATQNANALGPMAGMRGAFGKLLSEGQRELDNDFMQGMRNRNRYLDLLDEEGTLPLKKSYIDGTVVGGDQSLFTRLFNFVSPIKVSEEISPEKQFLMAIQYDATPSWLRASDGHEYTPTERSEIAGIMGEEGHFQREINRIMKKAEKMGWIKDMRYQRLRYVGTSRGGKNPLKFGFDSNEIPKEEWGNIFNELDIALADAKARAEQLSPTFREVLRARQDADINKARARQRQLPIIRNK